MKGIVKIQGIDWKLSGLRGMTKEAFLECVKLRTKGDPRGIIQIIPKWKDNIKDPLRIWKTIQKELKLRERKPTKKE